MTFIGFKAPGMVTTSNSAGSYIWNVSYTGACPTCGK